MAGEDFGQVDVGGLAAEDGGEDVAVVVVDGEVAGADEGAGGEVGPGGADFGAGGGISAEEEHGGAAAVVGAEGAVFGDAASELGEDHDVGAREFGGAEVGGEGVEAFSEAGHGGIHDGGLGDVGVPAAEVDGGGLEADAGFDEAGNLAEAGGKVVRRVVGLVGWEILGFCQGIDAIQGGEGGERGGTEEAGSGFVEVCELGEEIVREVLAEAEVIERLNGGAGGGSAEGFRELGADGDGGERGGSGVGTEAEESAEPTAGGESAVFHKVLGFKVGSGFVLGSGAVENGELLLLPPWEERGEMGVQTEKSVEVVELVAADADAGSGAVIAVVAVRDDHIQAVGAAAEEDDDESAGGVLLVVDEGGEGHGGGGRKGRKGQKGRERMADGRVRWEA